VSRPGDNETRKQYSSGKNKTFTLKTQLVTDGDHHIVAISTAVPGVMHDKKLGDEVWTLERLPEGCEVDADKGYQCLAEQVSLVTVRNLETGVEQQVPRVTVHTPFKKPKRKQLTGAAGGVQSAASCNPRARRTLHRLGEKLGDSRHPLSLCAFNLYFRHANDLWARERTDSTVASRSHLLIVHRLCYAQIG
jgi:hypothetical protein